MKKQNLKNKEIDQIGSRLLKVTKPSNEEIKKIVSNPRLFDSIKATMIARKKVMDKYDEISSLKTLSERREFLLKQSEEMKVALWLENIDQKTKEIELTAEQKEILEIIKKKFITVEFAESARGKSEEEAEPEYNEIMSRASQLLGKDILRELFVILGNSNTLIM